ncbi:MAG: UDP-3-O-(3-hydroxymyristoyl)glucosamine N-acyltransferase [Casimicrobiaceae bacterium]
MMSEPSAKKLSELARLFSAELVGADAVIHGVATLNSAGPGQITFMNHLKRIPELKNSGATAAVVRQCAGLPDRMSYLAADDPGLLFARIAQYFNPLPAAKAAIHPSAVIAASALLAPDVEIGAHVVIEEGAKIGAGAQLKAGVFVGAYSTIGAGTVLMPRVVVYANCVVGDRCRIHSGTIVGADGFGNAWAGDHWERIPQIGRVIIGDDVEIGANTTIDRGSLEDTVIESGVRLDNLIQIAHGVKIGRNTAIAACTGIAGSATIGAHCLIGGGVMIAGHTKMTDRVSILAGSGVPFDIHESGVYASGVPVVPQHTWLRNIVQFKKLNELASRIKTLEKAQSSSNPDHAKPGEGR